MMKKTVSELLLLLVLATSSVYAAETGSSTLVIPSGKWWNMPEMAKKINVTEAEKKKLDDLYIVFHRNLIDRKAVTI